MLKLVIALFVILMFVILAFCSFKLTQLRGKLRELKKENSELNTELSELIESSNKLDKICDEYRVSNSTKIIGYLSKMVYLEITLLRQARGWKNLSASDFDLDGIETILREMIFYKQLLVSYNSMTPEGILDRTKRISESEWAKQRFLEFMIDPENTDRLVTNPALVSGDLFLVDECIREILDLFKSESRPKSINRLITC